VLGDCIWRGILEFLPSKTLRLSDSRREVVTPDIHDELGSIIRLMYWRALRREAISTG